jgi:hypothetical protein
VARHFVHRCSRVTLPVQSVKCLEGVLIGDSLPAAYPRGDSLMMASSPSKTYRSSTLENGDFAVYKGQTSNSGKHARIGMLCVHFLTCLLCSGTCVMNTYLIPENTSYKCRHFAVGLTVVAKSTSAYWTMGKKKKKDSFHWCTLGERVAHCNRDC